MHQDDSYSYRELLNRTYIRLQSSQFQVYTVITVARFPHSSETTPLNLYFTLLSIPAVYHHTLVSQTYCKWFLLSQLLNFIIFQELFRCALILWMEFNGLNAAASHSSHIVAGGWDCESWVNARFNIRISTVIYLLSVDTRRLCEL